MPQPRNAISSLLRPIGGNVSLRETAGLIPQRNSIADWAAFATPSGGRVSDGSGSARGGIHALEAEAHPLIGVLSGVGIIGPSAMQHLAETNVRDVMIPASTSFEIPASVLAEASTSLNRLFKSSSDADIRMCATSSLAPFVSYVARRHVELIRSLDGGIDPEIAFYNDCCDPLNFESDGSLLFVRDAISGEERRYDIGDKKQRDKVRTLLIVSLAIEVIAIIAALLMIFLPPATKAVMDRLTAQIETNPGATRMILELAEKILKKDWGGVLALIKNSMEAGPLTGLIKSWFVDLAWWEWAIVIGGFIFGISSLVAGGPVSLGAKIGQLTMMLITLGGKVYQLEKADNPDAQPPPKGKRPKFPPRKPFPLPPRPPLPPPPPPPAPGEPGGDPVPGPEPPPRSDSGQDYGEDQEGEGGVGLGPVRM